MQVLNHGFKRADVAVSTVGEDESYIEEDEWFYGLLDEHPTPCRSQDDSSEDELACDELPPTLLELSDLAGSENDPSYIMPELDEERDIVANELQKGCGCSEDCYSQFTEDELYDIRLTMHELSKQEKDMLLLGKLKVLICPGEVIHARKVSKVKRRRITYQYAYDHHSVCERVFHFSMELARKV